MKVIDLLNKIANGEEIKAKLKFKLGDIIINYYGMNNYSRTPEYDIAYIDKGCTTHDFTLGTLIKSLNDEVEIIEDKKIKKLAVNLWCDEDKTCKREMNEKINEIIDYLKSKGDE